MSLEFSQVPLSSLSLGAVLSEPIYDQGPPRSKLLGKDVKINAHFLKQLEARGIGSVSVSKRDLAAMCTGVPQGNRKKATDHRYSAVSLETDRSRELDCEIASSELNRSADAQRIERFRELRTDNYDREAIATETHLREQQVEYVDNLFSGLVQGHGVDTEALSDICRSSISAVVADKDLFLRLGLNPFDSDYPSRHSLHVCSVAISIGVSLGLDDPSLIDLGTGCLIHDVGMLKLDQRLYKSKRQLKPSELTKLAEHPILTLEALACPGVSVTRVAQIVAYQIHERHNGTGYPRGIAGDEMHYLSQIAAVADAYVGLVSNRWHRRALMPYYAVHKILNSIPEGLFDPKVVRALLETVSLFPIGSFVETDAGQIGCVIRSTGETYMQPIVQLWDSKHNVYSPELVNLAKDNSIHIVKAVSNPKAA